MSAAVGGLTEAERLELIRGLGSTDSLVAAVEGIVARHVTAALNEAADAVEGWQQMAEWAASHTEDPDQAQNSHIRERAYRRAARIVRAAANP